MAMTLEELRKLAGTSRPTTTPKAQKMTLDELRKLAGTTAPVQQTRVQPVTSQPIQTAGDNSSAVSFADKMVENPVEQTVPEQKVEKPVPTITAKQKYGNTLYVPASAIATENEKRNKLNYVVNENLRHTAGWGMNNPYAQLDHISEFDRLAIADMVAKKDYDGAYKRLQVISKELDAKLADAEYKQVAQFAEEHPAAAGVVSIGNSLFKPAELGVNYADYFANKLQGKDTQFDTNASTFSTSRFSEAANEGIMKDDGIIGQLLKGSAMSMGNQLAVSGLVGKGPATEIFMAMQAAQDSLYENSKRGLTADEAVLNSLGKGAITYWAERFFPSEELLKIDADGVADTLWKSIAKGALPEGVEEVAENIVSNTWDLFQLKDKSEVAQLEKELKEQGVDKPTLKALTQKYIYDSLMGFAGGALAGGVMSGGVHMVNNALYGKNTGVNQQTESRENAAEKPVGVQAYVDTLKETAKADSEKYLNSKYVDSGMTVAQYAQNNVDGNFFKGGNHYYMEKNGKTVPVPKTLHDYAKYLQANNVQPTVASQVETAPEAVKPAAENIAPVAQIAQQTAPQTMNMTAPQTEAVKVAGDNNVTGAVQNAPVVDADNKTTAPTEEMKQLVRDIGADEAKQTEIKEYARAKGLGKTLDLIEAFAKRTGVTVRYYNGQLGQKVKGMREGNTIYVDVSNKNAMLYTAMHETIHALKDNNSKAYTKLAKRINSLKQNSDRYDVLAEMTADTYAEIGETDTTRVEDEIIAKLCEYAVENPEEFLAKFGKDRTVVDMVYDFLRELKNTITAYFGGSKAERARVDNALLALEQYLRNNVGETESGDAQFSVHTDADGNPYIEISEDILAGVQPKDWIATVKSYLSTREINMGHFDIAINGITRGEFTNSKSTSWLKRTDLATYKDKLRMAGKFDEIYQNAYNVQNEPAKHKNFESYNRGFINIRVGANDYSVEVLTGITSTNREVAYDIVGISPTKIKKANAPSVPVKNSTQTGVLASNTTIPQTQTTVNSNGTVTNNSGAVVATNVDNNGGQFNIQTFEDGGREFLERYLAKQKDMDDQEKQDILDSMDSIYKMVKEYNTAMSDEYPAFTQWCEAKPVIDDNGNVIMSVIVPNGDYKMNIDVSTVCKKRKTLDAVLNKMAESGDLSVYSMSQPDIVKMNKIIKKNGFEVACSMCFVDAKRYRIGNWANSFADMYNSIVETIIPEDSGIVLDQFNYSGAKVKTPKGRKADKVKTTELRWDEVNRMINDKSVKPIMREMAKAIKINPSMRKMLSSGDLISSKGMDNLKAQNAELYKLTNRHMGTAKPKTSHSETPYTNEVLKAEGWTPEKAYAVGGVRIQSFSDYMANMFFDYAQIIADLSAKKLPGHGYTKELDFAKIFGQTGLKINLSAMPRSMNIPADVRAEWDSLSDTKRKEHPLYIYYQQNAGLDAKGNYLWADESIDVDEAIKLQNTDGYTDNVGIICVGISDKHIRKLMADDNMKMVIPYHKSGINPVVAKMQDIDIYTDYTNEQNTRYAKSGKKIRKNSFHFDFYADLAKTNNPRQTAENYVRDCESRNFLPKFDRFAYKLDSEGNRIKGKDGKYVLDENYYKLLIDFRVYDANGKYAPQGAIKMKYPANLDQLVKDSLDVSEETAAKLDNKMTGLLKEIKKELSIKDSQRLNTKPIYSGNYEVKFDTQNSVDISDAQATGKYKGMSIRETAQAAIDASQQKRAKAQALLDERKQKNAKLVPEKWAKEQAEKASKDGLPESVGAAKANPKNITHMVNEYGEMKPGENPSRFVSMPVSTDGDDRVSLTARTLLEAPETIEEVQELLEQGVVEGLFSHDVFTDKKALNSALEDIQTDGFESIYKEFKRKIKNDIILTKGDIAKAAIMYATANKAGDTKTALDIATDMITRGTTMAQGLQAFRLFKKATPVDKLWAVEKMAKAIENDIKQKDKNFAGIKVDDSLKSKLTEAKTETEVVAVMEEIEQNIADQVPSDWIDKINAWRYMAMLANPRTHIRNILGNSLFVPMKSFKNAIGATIESGLEKSGKLAKDRRTKSLEAMTRRAKPFKEFAKKDFAKAQDIISGQSRYNSKQGVYDKVRVFDNNILEGIRKKNSDLLEAEDIFFLEKAYETAFAQAMVARGLKVSDVENNAKLLNEIRAIAIDEAQKATYRDANTFAKGFDNIKKGMRKKARNAENNRGKIGWALGNIIMEGTVPFTKTPSNIIRRGIEYSPVGVINGICDVNKRIKNGDVNLAEGIDRLSAGLSGTMIMALGALLSQLGAIRGAGDEDDNKKTIDELKGYQDYSLNFFGVNYTLDWMSPAAMPLFIGAELQKRFVEKEGFRFADLMDSIMRITEPVFDMTMLQGVNSAIKTAGYSKTNPATRIIENAAINYAGQFVPSAVGRLARTIDDTRRTTFDNKNNDVFNGTMQKFWQRTLNKLPGTSKNQIPYMNAWGETDTTENAFARAFENFVSPGYINKINNSDVNNEIERLYNQTGSAKVVPDKPNKYYTESGKTVYMTAKEYEKYSTIKGQTAYSNIEKLISDSGYKKLSDDEKVKLIDDIYAYSTTVAKKDVFNVAQTETNQNKRKLLESGLSPMDVFGRKNDIDTNGNGSVTSAEAQKYIDNIKGLNQIQRAYMFEVYYSGTGKNPYI